MNERGIPAAFLLRNSKGYPDFVMTMLVVVILALLVTILAWLAFNLVVFRRLDAEEAKAFAEFVQSFNDNARLIILGICSSVFTLAGTYFLRRASHDKQYAEREKTLLQATAPGVTSVVSGFVENAESTLVHPNYDDEEEDI